MAVSDIQTGEVQDPNTPLEGALEGAQRLERRLLVALGGGVLLAVSWIGHLFGAHQLVSEIPAALGAIILVIPLLGGAWKEIKSGNPSSDALASLAVVAALSAGMYLAAGFLAVFLWMANLILSRTAWGAQRAIRDLVDLTPRQARIVESGTERTAPLKEVAIGMIVRVRPGENLPADGVIISGHSDINQASLTGEAVPVEVQDGTEVYAGTTNLTGQIDVQVTAIAAETTIGKVESLIREAESTRTQKQELIEKIRKNSILTWGHVNMLGEYDFSVLRNLSTHPFDVPKILSLIL